MLPLWQYSSRQCLNHQLWRGGKPTSSCVPFSSVLWCSKLKALCLINVGLSSTSPHHQCHARRKLRSNWINKKQGTSPHPSTTASVITTTRVMFLTRAKGIRRMVLAVATTLTGAAATIAGRTEAHHPNP
jgi:hypothetical protein